MPYHMVIMKEKTGKPDSSKFPSVLRLLSLMLEFRVGNGLGSNYIYISTECQGSYKCKVPNAK